MFMPIRAEKQWIFKQPQPFRSCHASTLTLTAKGTLLAAWFGGSAEGQPDVDIWGAACHDGLWGEPRPLAAEAGLPHWNPVLFTAGESIYLFYKVGHNIPQWQTRLMQSADHGASWSAPRPLVSGDVGGRGPVRSRPIVLANGDWLAPASIEGEHWHCFVDRSTDAGNTWQAGPIIPLTTPPTHKGTIQPTLWQSQPGHVHMLMRSTERRIYRSDSTDGGWTWCPAYPTDLPNNNSGIDIVRWPDGSLFLAYNPVAENWGKRTPLVLALSTDNGHTWPHVFTLEDEPGEYSYPTVLAGPQGTLYVSYTWQRQSIVVWQFVWPQQLRS